MSAASVLWIGRNIYLHCWRLGGGTHRLALGSTNNLRLAIWSTRKERSLNSHDCYWRATSILYECPVSQKLMLYWKSLKNSLTKSLALEAIVIPPDLVPIWWWYYSLQNLLGAANTTGMINSFLRSEHVQLFDFILFTNVAGLEIFASFTDNDDVVKRISITRYFNGYDINAAKYGSPPLLPKTNCL